MSTDAVSPFQNSWLMWAMLSAAFAALTAIFAKVGVENIDSDLATFIRTVIVLISLALILLASGQRAAAATVMFLVSLAYLGNAGLGVYHAGAEWKYWPGPDTCGATGPGITKSAGSLLKQLETTTVIRCDEAPWRFLGLSFAGWNVVVSMMLWITLQQAAFAAAAELKAKIE